MVTTKKSLNQDHSSAWIAQTWLSFIISISATAMGIFCLPVDGWIKGFMGMGLTIGDKLRLPVSCQAGLGDKSRGGLARFGRGNLTIPKS